MGWTAATGHLGAEAFSLFAILFAWQIPHFLAIGEMYKHDYRRGGFPMLGVIDETGAASGRQAVVYASILIPVSMLCSMLGVTGSLYFWSALVLGLVYAGFSAQAARAVSLSAYRRLLLVSVIYLPALLTAMVIDRFGF
jgi:protoheme IX farnesyltransferase